MTHDRFDELMDDAATSYRRPPEPPLDEMWAEVERGLKNAARGTSDAPTPRRYAVRAIQIAATLVVGIAIGRASTSFGKRAETSPPNVATVSAASDASNARADTSVAEPYQVATTRYLGQTAALLMALPSEVRAGRADEQFITRAGDLLTTTRLLLDSPAANDQSMHNLLEDLELVLAQVVRLQNDRGHAALDLINQALEQRDVIPRLRLAAADISADN